MRTRRQLGLFLAAYVIYDLGRWVAHGDIGPATDHARWVLDLERGLGVAVERSVQHALDAGPVMWLLSNVYLAAQLAVLPGSLVYLYRRAPAVYERLRGLPRRAAGRPVPARPARRRRRRGPADRHARGGGRMIRVAVLDRHPAMRDGARAILDAHPGLAAAGAAADPGELDVVLYRARPDVVLIEQDAGARDGLALCLAITARPADAAARLAPRDRAIFAMRLADTAPGDIERTVGLRPGELHGRLQAIVAALAAGDAPDHPHGVPELAVPIQGEAA